MVPAIDCILLPLNRGGHVLGRDSSISFKVLNGHFIQIWLQIVPTLSADLVQCLVYIVSLLVKFCLEDLRVFLANMRSVRLLIASAPTYLNQVIIVYCLQLVHRCDVTTIIWCSILNLRKHR